MQTVGVEPQLASVAVYQAGKLIAPATRAGAEANDIYIQDKKVVVLGLDADGGEQQRATGGAASDPSSQTEFVFDNTYNGDVLPSAIAQESLMPLVQAAVRGVHGLLLVLGQSGSGKSELVHGLEPAEAERKGLPSWHGLANELLEATYNQLPSDSLSSAEDRFSVRMQFLSIVEERVQDLLQPNCHAHDLQIVDRAGGGTEVVGADEVELKSAAQGIRLYSRATDELHRLARYHGVDPTAQTTILTVSVRRRGVPRTDAGGAPGDLAGALHGSVTLVELPGTERLSVDRSRLHVSEEAFVHRSITHFSELVAALARRDAPDHVPWRGGKLTTLLADRLGMNALVRGVATVRPGAAAVSAATLRCAAALGKVRSYPVVNSAAALGQRTVLRSEILALRSDLRTLTTKGFLSNTAANRIGAAGGELLSPGGAAGGADGAAGDGAPAARARSSRRAAAPPTAAAAAAAAARRPSSRSRRCRGGSSRGSSSASSSRRSGRPRSRRRRSCRSSSRRCSPTSRRSSARCSRPSRRSSRPPRR